MDICISTTSENQGFIPLINQNYLRICRFNGNSTEYQKFPLRTSITMNKNKMKKTTIELSEEQYFFLKEKSLALQRQRKNYSLVSIIRDLIDEDQKKWIKGRK